MIGLKHTDIAKEVKALRRFESNYDRIETVETLEQILD